MDDSGFVESHAGSGITVGNAGKTPELPRLNFLFLIGGHCSDLGPGSLLDDLTILGRLDCLDPESVPRS